MLISELMGKEIVNLNTGAKLGCVGESDLVFSSSTGLIESLVLPSRGGYFAGIMGRSERDFLVIPWQNIKVIGKDLIIVDIPETHNS